MRLKVTFSPTGWDEYAGWATDKRTRAKIDALIGAIMRDPYEGPGHPERLRGAMAGWWSRKIDEKNRLVYRIDAGQFEILSCSGHYSDH